MTLVFFPLATPYWYLSIVTFSLFVIIAMLKLTWDISVRFSDKIDEIFDNEKYEITYTFNEDRKKS